MFKFGGKLKTVAVGEDVKIFLFSCEMFKQLAGVGETTLVFLSVIACCPDACGDDRFGRECALDTVVGGARLG